MNPAPPPPPFLIALVAVLALFIIGLMFLLARSTPKSVRRFRDYQEKRVVTVEDLTFENRVITALQIQTGCWGKPNDRGLIEVYKKDKLVGIVKCCEDSWEVTPSLINEMAKLKVWYHVRVAYIATGGAIPSMAKSEAKHRKIRILVIDIDRH
jgi:hypothetical protein